MTNGETGRVLSLGFGPGDGKRILWSFVYGFVSFLVIQAPGLLSAANYNEARALALSLLAGAIAAGLSAVKNYLAGPRIK